MITEWASMVWLFRSSAKPGQKPETLPGPNSSRRCTATSVSLLNYHRWSMPPRIRGALSTSLLHVADSGGGFFYCPSCATWRRTLSTRPSALQPRRGHRLHHSPIWNSDQRRLATSSVLNAGRNVPDRFRELYEALDEVKNTAPEQLSLSRLQLALRGLESETPLIRIAGRWRECYLLGSFDSAN